MDLRDNLQVNEAHEICCESEEASTATETVKKSRLQALKDDGFFKPYFVVLLALTAFSLIVYVISRLSPAFAEFWARYPSQGIRFAMAKLSGITSFSIAECILITIPLSAIAYIVASARATKRDDSRKSYFKWLVPLISVLLAIMILFCLGFGPCYGRYTLDRNLGIERSGVSAEELYGTALIVAELAKAESKGVTFASNGGSVMKYDYDELIEKINAAYESYAPQVDYLGHFSSYPKAIALSEPMTYTHISGVYTFMTGEANININYPDFITPFTVAHEMAHQRGIAREDEANFVAYLVCISSDDAYVRYSGYMNMLDYLLDALYSADKDMFVRIRNEIMSQEMVHEYVAYSLFFEKYRDSVASEVTGTVNNAFLQSQGQSEGTRSYGLVVDLAVAYYKTKP